MMDGEELPPGWVTCALGDLIPKPRPKVSADANSELPFIGMDHIEAEGFRLIGQARFADMKSAGSYFLPGDVLYGRLRPYLNKVHRAKFEGVASAEFIVLPSAGHFDSDFVRLLLHQRQFVDFAMSKASGDRPRIKFDSLAAYNFALPPLAEQQRIVEKVETLFAELNKGEEALRDVQKLLARYRQSVLNAAVTGTLTADWRATNGPPNESGKDLLTRILKTRRETWQGRGKYKEPVGPDTDGLPELPEGWIVTTTDQLAFVDTGATPKKGKSEYYASGEIPWVTSTAVNDCLIEKPQDYITPLAVKETNAKVFPKGTLIVALYGEGKTRGKVSKLGIDAATNQACAGLRVAHLPHSIAEYLRLFYVYNYEAIRLLSAGGVQPNLNLSIIRETSIPLPPLKEAEQILDAVDEAMGRATQALNWCKAELKRSAALRQSILQDAFAGKLVPQDPSDEPASALLERIRAARRGRPKAKGKRATA